MSHAQRPGDVVMPFGMHEGETLDAVADVDILYLDWLIGQEWFTAKFAGIAAAVAEVLDLRSGELDAALEE